MTGLTRYFPCHSLKQDSCQDQFLSGLLSDKPLFLLLSAHTPGCSAQVLENVLRQALDGLGGTVESGEMLLTGAPGVIPLPSGTYVRWHA